MSPLHGGPDGDQRYNVSWGFVEVLPDRVTILASDALKPEEIDVPRAQEQLDRGHKMWNEAGESEEAYDVALHVIAEAKLRLPQRRKSTDPCASSQFLPERPCYLAGPFLSVFSLGR